MGRARTERRPGRRKGFIVLAHTAGLEHGAVEGRHERACAPRHNQPLRARVQAVHTQQRRVLAQRLRVTSFFP